MTKGNFFRYYNKLSGSDRYLVFFEHNGNIYMHDCPHIAPRWTHEERESTKNGGWQKWKMYISSTEKARLVKKSVVVMTSAEFNAMPIANKGHRCECYLHKAYDLGDYTPDNLRFDKGADVIINGIGYQVKFENATLTNVNVLHKAQAEARAER